jgi:putative DNA primase/helicase
MFCTTNYTPRVDETDHGTWRRLAMLRFPFTFLAKGKPLITPNDRHGDSGLRDRLKDGRDGRHDAIVTWVVEGAMAYFADPDDAMALTQKVEDDTREWRMGSDRILGFWDEALIPDRDRAVITEELHNTFNRWLDGNGHRGWSREMFQPRFAQHMETTQNRVEKGRPRKAKGLSRAPHQQDRLNPTPTRPEVYMGVRFREPKDDETPGQGGGQRGQPQMKLSLTETDIEKVTNTSDHSDHVSDQGGYGGPSPWGEEETAS